jgi:hypothetical protein
MSSCLLAGQVPILMREYVGLSESIMQNLNLSSV